jgi:hypothetical protein
MKLMMLLTADYASVEPLTGKLNVLGAFSQIRGNNFPLKHGRMFIAVRVRAELTDHHDQRTLAIGMTDDDQHKLFHISGPIQFPHTGTGLPGELNAVIELNELIFPHPGFYNFVVSIDGEELGSTPVKLVQK